MVRHIVLWKLKETDKAENAAEMKRRLEALRGNIPGLLELEVGLDSSGAEAAADISLYSTLESWEALRVYQIHPLHQDVAAFVGTITKERRVSDYEI